MLIAIVDTETTGMTPEDEIIELAMVYLNPHHQSDFTSYESAIVRSNRPISPEARGAHHISPEEVAGGVDLHEMLMQAWKMPIDAIAAHNAPFDKGYLLPHLSHDEVGAGDVPWVCTWTCARHIWAEAPSFGLQALRYWLDLDVQTPPGLYPHRALYDAFVCHALTERMLKHASLEELIVLTDTPVLLEKINFGKHKGSLWKDLPYDYLQWCSRQPDWQRDEAHTIQYWLNARK